jgi:soluble cytochrome b562
VSEAIAADLVQQQAQVVELQIEILDHRLAGKNAAKIADPAAWLVSAIKKPHTPPKGFSTNAERQAQADAARQADQQAAAKRRQEREQEARDQEFRQRVNAHLKQLDQAQRLALETDALAAASPKVREDIADPGMASVRDTQILMVIREYLADRPELMEQVAVDA